jgi:GNAT superfamily N-acetyltransferase
MPLDVHGPNGATLHEVHAQDAHLLDIACNLFLSIFPEDKRHLSYIRACAHGRYPCHPNTMDHVWLVEQAGEWVGLRIFSSILTRNFGYGAYVGFLPNARGQGLGRWLADLVHEQLDADAQAFDKPGSIGFVGEVQRPIDCETDEEQRYAERRLQFHRRCGSMILPVPFIEPVMIEGVDYLSPEDIRGETPRPMYLFFNPSKLGREIQNLDLVNFIQGIYLDVYLFPRQHEYIQHSLSHLYGE